MTKLVRVFLISDHNLIRAGLRLLLQEIAGVRVVGEASDHRDASALIGRHYPEVILIVATLRHAYGLSIIKRILKEYPEIPVIDLSSQEVDEYSGGAVRAVIKGYLQKEATPADLKLALSKVADGELYTNAVVANKLRTRSIRRSKRKPTSTETLTPRQREVLKLIIAEYSSKEISEKLHISIKTVESHRLHLMDRLGVRNVAGLVRAAIQDGFSKPKK